MFSAQDGLQQEECVTHLLSTLSPGLGGDSSASSYAPTKARSSSFQVGKITIELCLPPLLARTNTATPVSKNDDVVGNVNGHPAVVEICLCPASPHAYAGNMP